MVGSFAAYVARTAYVLIGCAGLLSLLAACATVGVAPSTPTAVPISREQQVWTMPSLYRVGQHDAPGVDPDASIAAARGEYESFQIIVRAPRGGLRNLGLSLSAFVGPDGAQIGGKDVTLYRAHYVQVVQPSHDPQTGNRPSGAGWYADALIPLVDPESGGRVSGGEIPAMPALLAAGQNQPFWIDVFIPRDSLPGKYTARYTFSSDKGTSVGNVTLTVWNFELPIRPSLTTSFLMRERTTETRTMLLQHRLMPFTTPAREQRDAIDTWGLSAQGTGLWSGAQKGECQIDPPVPVNEIQAIAAKSEPDLLLYAYSADEIDECTGIYEGIKAWARNLHAAGVNNLIPMTPVEELFDDGSGSGRSAVDIWVVLPVMYDRARDLVEVARAKGDQVWSYNALVQDDYSPKWQIDFAPINYRIQPGFISQSLGLTGLLYWSVDRWTADPWNDVNTYTNKDGWHFPGEGMLVYPGRQVGLQGVVPSMRLKWLRDGVEDYEYIELLKHAGREQDALLVARSVGADWHSWTRDPAALALAREQLASMLEQSQPGS